MHGPGYPAESLCGAIVDSVYGKYLSYHPGIGANAAGGDDHTHAAIYQYYKRCQRGEVGGIGQAHKTKVYLAKVHEPDKGGVADELPPFFHMEDREHTMGQLLHKAAQLSFTVAAVNDDRNYEEKGNSGNADGEDDLVLQYLAPEVLHHAGDKTTDGAELEQQGQHGNNEQAEDIEGALGHNGAYHFVGGHFFVLGQDGALCHLTATRYGEIGDIAYEHGKSSVGKGGSHAGSIEEVAPAHCPEKMGQETNDEDGENIPEVDPAKGSDEFVGLLRRQLMEHVVNDPDAEPQEDNVL